MPLTEAPEAHAPDRRFYLRNTYFTISYREEYENHCAYIKVKNEANEELLVGMLFAMPELQLRANAEAVVELLKMLP